MPSALVDGAAQHAVRAGARVVANRGGRDDARARQVEARKTRGFTRHRRLRLRAGGTEQGCKAQSGSVSAETSLRCAWVLIARHPRWFRQRSREPAARQRCAGRGGRSVRLLLIMLFAITISLSSITLVVSVRVRVSRTTWRPGSRSNNKLRGNSHGRGECCRYAIPAGSVGGCNNVVALRRRGPVQAQSDSSPEEITVTARDSDERTAWPSRYR